MEIHLRVFESLKYVETNTQTDRQTGRPVILMCAAQGWERA